jgi:crotonobetainyl-CoA:carnitine CoA-transferase CaiB-like acyl-CoA transferase
MYVGTWAATKGYEPPRRANSAHPSIVPFQNFRTADGWVVVACAKQSLWEALCGALEMPELARDELLAILDDAFARRGTDEWLDVLREAGVPSGRVNPVTAALEDPQAVARDAVVAVEHPRLGTVREVASPLRVADAPRAPGPGPARGAHTDAVLRELCGYGDERLAQLRAEGVFGPA